MSLPEVVIRTRQPLHLPVPDEIAADAVPGVLDSPDIVLAFDIEQQDPDRTFWCWAAVAVSLRSFLRGESMDQCELAARVFNGFDCCQNPVPCDVMKPLETALAQAGVFRGRVMSPVQPPAIVTELQRQTPLGCAIRWNTGSAHFVVLYGISPDIDGTPSVSVDDPSYGKWEGPYTSFRDAYLEGAGRWIASYFTA